MDEEAQKIKLMQSQNYKAELDKQLRVREQMRAYGNMSAAEKAMNKDDLIAYKHNINKNYALIPGI